MKFVEFNLEGGFCRKSPMIGAAMAAFPEAQKIGARLWTLRLETVKMIDNTRGFGFKELWASEVWAHL